MNQAPLPPRARLRPLLLERVLEEQDRIIAAGTPTEVLVNDTVYHELERLKGAQGRGPARERRFWGQVGARLVHAKEEEKRELLRLAILRYAEEVMGHFDPRMYNLATRVVPVGVLALLNRFSPATFLTSLSNRLRLKDSLIVSGAVDPIRSLARQGTLIMTPTHLSHLDSVVIGLAMYLARLPRFTYGAGLNLFANPVVAFFLNNLGAYKVDRRKRDDLYKSVLKQYAELTMEMGEHNLFFPGGTRNRVGGVERHLKLGLLGCGLNAYIRNLRAGKPRPDLFVVPCTLSYGLVPEAKSLVEEHLRQEGQGRFIPRRGELSRPLRVLAFLRNLQSLDSKLHIHFGRPLDLFGNPVDKDGVSRDPHGHPVDRTKYVRLEDGAIGPDPQRDREYTRGLGEAIQAAYRRDNIALSTHIAAFAFFAAMARRHARPDLYRILRDEGEGCRIAEAELFPLIERLMAALRARADRGELQVDSALRGLDGRGIFESAFARFATYHDKKVFFRREGHVYTEDMKLIYYYRNKLDGYGLEGELA